MILITGIDGFLGANLCLYLQAQGHEVIGMALNRKRETSLDALNVNVGIEYGDILDTYFIDRVINAYEPDMIFHLAGVSIVRVAQADPRRVLSTNIMGTVNVLEVCRKLPKSPTVVISTSDKAYGDHNGIIYDEESPLLPHGPYEVSKACADHIARMYASIYNLPVMVARCANLYGPGDLHWSRLVPNSCRLALSGRPPQVYGAAWTNKREWLYVESACRAFRIIAESGESGEAYNVGDGETYTPAEVAAQISTLCHGPQPAKTDKAFDFYEIAEQKLDSSKLQEIGWTTRVKMSESLSYTVAWYRGYLEAAQ